ncbi:peptidoglycan DD-metalloendopeptidase family protein [Paraflavisolibacter sp. H34]|uniref:murein hydrolase activator EnvC family protein n=1 Tax=Huijunlia imazamoxiresistens TaxID=3127457 RepID=UPI0030194F7C
MKKLLTGILFSACFITGFAQGQDRSKMEKERQAIQKELSEIQSVYQQVKGQRKETIGQLNLLQRKMSLQGRYISNINKEIKLVSDEIYLSTLEINRLQRQLDTLKMQYERSVVYAYKNRSTYDYLNFIFSASSFNDALKRVSYLKSYRSYRQQQVTNIVQTKQEITDKKSQLLGKKTQKNDALQNQTQQMTVLEDQKKEKDQVVAKLQTQEKDLQKQITTRKKRDAQLKSAIAAVIRREIELARKEAERKAAEKREAERRELARREAERKAAAEKAERERLARLEAERRAAEANKPAAAPPVAAAPRTTPAATPPATTTAPPATSVTTPPAARTEEPKAAPTGRPKSYLDLNETDVALNNSFEGNRARLPWPVDNGYVCIPFGTSKVGNLSMDNPGITVCTPSAGVNVKSVFDGEVSSVANIGDGMTVIIRHGKYFTIYSNLSAVSVSKGMAIRTGQSLGRAAAADDGNGGQIDFMLMIESRNVNPEPWLRRR